MTKKQHAQQKFHRVLREYSNGELYSHDGKKVTNYKRAIAIAFSEARKYDKNFGASKHENGTKIKTDNTLQLIFEDAFQRYLIDRDSRLANIENGKRDKLISFDEWLRTTTTGLKYNKRIAQLIRYDETHEPNMNSRGAKLRGRSHARGGIPGINVDTNEPIEVEGGELIITKGIGKIKQHITCHGEPEGIASRLNELSGGDKISDAPATCHLKQEIMERGKKINSKQKGLIQDLKKIEKELNKQSVKFVQFDENNVGINAQFNGFDIEEYDYIENGENKSLPKKIISLIDKYNYVYNSYIRAEKQMENGNKIQSYIEQRKIENIEQKIQRENEMKNNEIELTNDDKIIRVNDDKSFAIVCNLENRDFSSIQIFKYNDICIYHAHKSIVDFLEKYEIHYTEFDDDKEFYDWFKSLLPSRTRNKLNK